MNIYQHKSEFKIVIFSLALVIGLASLYYTNSLVNKLVEREKEQIELYAAALRYTLDIENDQPLTFIYQEIILSNKSIPVISTDIDGNILSQKNIRFPKNASEEEKQRILENELEVMKEENPPIVMVFGQNKENRNFIYYRNSYLIYQLRYYPYAQLSVIAIFGFLTYMAFNYSRKAEQNRVWIGLAKETAHQLGTPISSLMAWVEYLRDDDLLKHSEVLPELEKDVKRLEMITARFSNIGSKPALHSEDVHGVVKGIVSYLRPRISNKVDIHIINYLLPETQVKMNRYLFEWVVENLCKNAVDAMNSVGSIEIKLKITANHRKIIIDISDTGKGIQKSKIKKVFEPGYTTKKRGWGLGLTLAKRIIEDYHGGKIFVKSSEPNKGSKFRIVLNQETPEGIFKKYEIVNKLNPFTEQVQ
ncbi:MAG: PAS domain-containing sensor histidine kinase [Thermonemataceae bacterium]